MPALYRFSILIALGAIVAQGQTTSVPTKDEVLALNTLVVTGSPDAKTAFDLAQGASILTGEKLLLSQQATLGETLASTPGVNATYYGPGASRPIIRGLGGDRVRMLDNGVGSLDASNISPDHNVSVEPLLVDRIEVLRGPATLLYGSSAVGGVVNVIDNRIPSTAPTAPVSGRAEARFDTAANERTGILAFNGGNGHFGLQVNGLRTETDDVDIPGFAQSGPEAPADQPHGTLPSSAISTKSGSVGGTYFWDAGSFGAAVSDYETTYGVPTGDDPPTSIDMHQRRLDLRGEITQPFALFKSARIRFGLGDYTHSELSGGTQINTTFKNKAYEGRLELVQQDVGALTGTVGLQTSRSDFSAVGDEVVTPATVTTNHALFALEEYKFERVTLQFGGRYEFQRIKVGEVDPDLPAFPGYDATTGERRNDHGLSLSTGAVYYPAKDYSLGFSVAYSERLPVAQELFSNGPHGGTAAYEVGTSDLGKEKSLGFDLTLRKRAGFVTGSVGVFANTFNDFVFEQQQPGFSNPTTGTDESLPTYQFIARDALFYGGEAEVTLHLVDTDDTRVHLELTSDTVHAEQTTDDVPLPRIPPWRIGAALRYAHGPWSAGIEARHAFKQDRFTATETETGGYTLLGTDVTYQLTLGRVVYELFARGSNLTDEEARVSTSFLKDYAPLPGRDVTFGVRANF